MVVAAVPVKDLVNAKRRLLRVLGAEERMALARAMLSDVLRAFQPTGIDVVWVVTRDGEVAAIARALGAEVLVEADNRGHSTAVALAQARARQAGARLFATVPGDVPAVTAAELRTLIETGAGHPRRVVFAPSRSGLGTNGVALAPPDAMPLTFGEPSFENHLAAARERGFTPHVVTLPGLALDVDDPDDLQALVAEAPATESGRLAADWARAGRLTAPAG
jgi:2-phospho-L-lactate guanylyltransferase